MSTQSLLRRFLLGFVLSVFPAIAAVVDAADRPPAERPNILWVTAEDICPNLACFGDPDAVTPHIDRFAAQGERFSNVFSVHPCCSPSRSCLVTSVYPTRLGTFQHRAIMWVNPELVKCFPSLLREAGYYCYNGDRIGWAKLDYNFTPRDQPWDKINDKAEVGWRRRRPGQPFFGQLNLFRTHQSQYGLRKPGTPVGSKKGEFHDPAKMHIPPYYPDTPAVREIWAEYQDRITQMDEHFGNVLQRLADDGLADDTIVFFFGDNGQGVPGGKVWLWDQGPHVPLIVRIPQKWQHLAVVRPGSSSDRLISFLDFAPTTLSLAGVEIPGYMQGIPFLGPKEGSPRKYVYAARDFHDGADFDTSRMVRNERYHYIRNFMPQQGWDAILYSWEHAPYLLDSWRQQAEAGKLLAGTRQACFFRRTKFAAEELYDMHVDPYQMHNLAADPRQREVLQQMRTECARWMLENHDLGLLSQYELFTRSEKDSPYEMGADPQRNPLPSLLAAADLANRGDPQTIPSLRELLKHPDAALRRWGALGLLALRDKAAPAADVLSTALADPSPDVRMTAAEALCGLGRAEAGTAVLIDLLTHESRIIRNETLLALCRVGRPAQAALPYLEKALGPSKHSGIWSYDNIPAAISLARSCLSDQLTADGIELPPTKSHPVAASSRLKATRTRYLP